jgi:hypothetical protein
MITAKRFFEGAVLTTGAVAYYTVPTDPLRQKALIKKLTFTNTSGTARDVTVYLVPSGGTAGVGNLLEVRNVAAGETWSCDKAINHVLEGGDSIQAKAAAASAITATGSGAEMTSG